jgi:mono/diheme cytochrome c family protein
VLPAVVLGIPANEDMVVYDSVQGKDNHKAGDNDLTAIDSDKESKDSSRPKAEMTNHCAGCHATDCLASRFASFNGNHCMEGIRRSSRYEA